MVDCKWCGNMTENTGTEECDACWQLRKRIEWSPSLAVNILRGVVGPHPDEKRIDFLQMLTNRKEYTGRVILRRSDYGRGWRMHESERANAVPDVRQAIDDFMEEYLLQRNHFGG
jgi:hypothetical protein